MSTFEQKAIDAFQCDDWETCRSLVEDGADPNAENEGGRVTRPFGSESRPSCGGRR